MLPDTGNRAEDVNEFLDWIDELLDGGYDWAKDTLNGIRAGVKQLHAYSPGQFRAVTNIANAGQRRTPGDLPSDRRHGSRRYEGWTKNE